MAVSQTWRGLVSLTLFVSGIIAAITGIVLYIVPEGRVAYWVIWELLGLSKPAWQAVHTLSSLLLLVFAVLHVINNWRSIKKYLFTREGKPNMVRESILAVALSLIIVFSAILRLPPLIWVMDAGAWLKSSWVISPEYEPPFGHAEELSLRALAQRMNIDLPAATQALSDAGFTFKDSTWSLERIARENSTTPMHLYTYIKPHERKIDTEQARSWTDADIEARFAGTGIGRKTIAQLAEQLNMPLQTVLTRLAEAGVETTGDEKIKEIKERSEIIAEATDLIRILLLKKE